MLKWTVHKQTDPTTSLVSSQTNPRRSLGNLSRPTVRHREIKNGECRRKSLGSSEMTRRIQNRNKENNHILTPHPIHFRNNLTSTPQSINKIDFALRDVRNLTPKNSGSITSLSATITPSRKRPLPKTPPSSPTHKKSIPIISTPAPYASTLPTFDVEYSPCGPTTICRMKPPTTINTIPITDSYFNQPRYFQEPVPAPKRLKFSPSSIMSTTSRPFIADQQTNIRNANEKTKFINNNCDSHMNKNNNSDSSVKFSFQKASISDESLSSSALNDTALDKMIDAILESARKERPTIRRNNTGRKVYLPIGINTATSTYTESPTYTAAEDPASDLLKYCDNYLISPKQPTIAERTIILDEIRVNEREVKTPEVFVDTKHRRIDENENIGLTSSCHLRRQRAVRRKHQNKNVKNKKLLKKPDKHQDLPETNSSPKTPNDINITNSSFYKKTTDELANMNTPTIYNNLNDDDQQPQCEINSNTSKISYDFTPIIHTKDLRASSTPTNDITSIRRCLDFSRTGDDDSLEKRKSTASSTVSISSTSTSSYSRIMNNVVSGSLDVNIFVENNKLNIHGELV